jgi:CBS domain-containing protein
MGLQAAPRTPNARPSSAGRLAQAPPGVSDREGLEEAFRLLWQVRLEHQVRPVRQGQAPDDYIDPKELGSVTRQGVKAAFRVIDAVQRTLALEFDLHRA